MGFQYTGWSCYAILKQFGNRLNKSGITAEIGQVQKAVLLGTARILRKVLEMSVDCGLIEFWENFAL